MRSNLRDENKRKKRIIQMHQRLTFLVQQFNMLRDTNADVNKTINKIAELSINIYQEVYSSIDKKTTNINKNLISELIQNISVSLLNANKIEIKLDEHRNLRGIVDDDGNLIFGYGVIDKYSYSDINEFLHPVGRRTNFNQSTVGFLTSDAISYNNKLYKANGNKKFTLRDDSYYIDKSILQQDDYFICKSYDENSLESISYVYPNMNDNGHDIGYVGYIIKYSKYLREVISYKRTQTDECSDTNIQNLYDIIEEPTVIDKKTFLGWNFLGETSTNEKGIYSRKKINISNN